MKKDYHLLTSFTACFDSQLVVPLQVSQFSLIHGRSVFCEADTEDHLVLV